MKSGPDGVVGYGAGARAGGITLLATASHFEALPPPFWQAFKKAVKSLADGYGLQLAISDHPSITEAQQRFWQMNQAQENARLAGSKDGG